MSKMHLIKKEKPTDESISDESKANAIDLAFNLKPASIDDKKEGTKNLINLSDQPFGLFKKYLCTDAHNNFGGKTNEEEFEVIRRNTQRGPFMPLKINDNVRPPTLLERALFPGLKEDVKLPKLTENKSPTAQLTIFYSGTINVYDNISVEKAEAIMLIARESCSVAHTVKNVTESRPSQTSNLSSICKLQAAELPVARKLSLERFFKKRRDRIINKSPYAASTRT